MKLFSYSLSRYQAAFRRDNYILAKDAVSAEFLAFATAQLKRCRASGYNELPAREIKSKKKQYLFDLPEGENILRELVQSVSALAGLPPDSMNVSERHVMVYDDRAAPLPPLHKDRLASRFSIGIPLEAAPHARIALLANGPNDRNLLDKAIYCPQDENPSTRRGLTSTLNGSTSRTSAPSLIQLDAQPGDAVIFTGSSMFHGRLNAASSSILYFKVSDLHLDPLCEDPATLRQRAASIKLLQRVVGNDSLLKDSWLDLSPRLQNISRIYSRSSWTTVLRMTVSGEGEHTISDQELKVLFKIRGRSRVRDVVDLRTAPGSNSELQSVRRLVELGAIDLVS